MARRPVPAPSGPGAVRRCGPEGCNHVPPPGLMALAVAVAPPVRAASTCSRAGGGRCRCERPHREKRPCARPAAHPVGHENAGRRRTPRDLMVCRLGAPVSDRHAARRAATTYRPPRQMALADGVAPSVRAAGTCSPAFGGRCRSETGAPSRPRRGAGGRIYTATGRRSWRSSRCARALGSWRRRQPFARSLAAMKAGCSTWSRVATLRMTCSSSPASHPSAYATRKSSSMIVALCSFERHRSTSRVNS